MPRTVEELEHAAKALYDYMVIVYVRPNHPGHVLVSCLSFFVMSKVDACSLDEPV